MALITRLSRLFKADVHAVLDHIEEPEVLLRQAIREMQDVIAQDEQRLKLTENELRQMKSRKQQMQHGVDEIETKLDVCFRSQEDDLARSLIKRKLEMQKHEQHLINRQADLQQVLQDLKGLMSERKQTLHSMQQKASLLATESAKPDVVDDWQTSSLDVRDEDVEVAFLQEKQRRASA